MSIKSCVQCGSSNLIHITDTIETIINNKTLVIPNIPAIKCVDCNEVYYTPEASRYIDKQVTIFKADGFENNCKEVIKQKGITQEQLGNMLGVTKQRVNQIYKDDNLDVKTMYKIANAVNEPIQSIFNFNHIVNKDSKYYIEKTKE